jgi:hypothetical protein
LNSTFEEGAIHDGEASHAISTDAPRANDSVALAAYQVSGEYAMINSARGRPD